MMKINSIINVFKYGFGFILRESGLALDKRGAKMENDISYKQKLSRHRTIFPINYIKANFGKNTKVSHTSTIVGSVFIDDNSVVMFNSTIKGDFNNVIIGKNSYIGNNNVIITSNMIADGFPSSTNIGDNVIIGNNCIIHSSTIDDNVIIEDNCIIKEGSIIESNTIIKSNSVIDSVSNLKGNGVWEGTPVKKIANITDDKEFVKKNNKIKENLKYFEEDKIFIQNF